jgi:hypothetical protein
MLFYLGLLLYFSYFKGYMYKIAAVVFLAWLSISLSFFYFNRSHYFLDAFSSVIELNMVVVCYCTPIDWLELRFIWNIYMVFLSSKLFFLPLIADPMGNCSRRSSIFSLYLSNRTLGWRSIFDAESYLLEYIGFSRL